MTILRVRSLECSECGTECVSFKEQTKDLRGAIVCPNCKTLWFHPRLIQSPGVKYSDWGPFVSSRDFRSIVNVESYVL